MVLNSYLKLEDANDAYIRYIEEHKLNLQKAWGEAIHKFVDKRKLSIYDMHMIHTQVEEHDKSKYNKNEFEGYRMKFYPHIKDPPSDVVDMLYHKAWLNHIHQNPHHWQHWVVPGAVNKAINIPFNFVIEMLLDWKAMSYRFNDRPRSFFENNRHLMLLSDGTIEEICFWLPVVDENK